MKTFKSKIKIIVVLIFIILFIWVLWANTALELNKYVIKSDKLPASFDGYRIAHISDLHNAEFGADNKRLLSIIKEADPDIVVITGDMIDSRKTDTGVAIQFAEGAMRIAPCYYVTGNHESRILEYDAFEKNLKELGVTVLRDEKIKLQKSESSIELIGVDDPDFDDSFLYGDYEEGMYEKISDLKSANIYTMLLSHRPELFDIYEKSGIDLVFTGHAHGGQFILPFAGGIVAPHQGLFPEYYTGKYTSKNTNMMVSRGIGNSLFPLRFNNRPEVILVELKSGV